MQPDTATRWRRIGTRIAGVVKSYVSVNLLLAIAAGVFTWLVLELLGVDLAVTMGVIVGFLDLVPLVGFTVGGFFVAIVAAFHDFPGALIVWLVLFLVYQQVQDRVIQPLLYKNAVQSPSGGGDHRDPGRRRARRHPRRPARDPDRRDDRRPDRRGAALPARGRRRRASGEAAGAQPEPAAD